MRHRRRRVAALSALCLSPFLISLLNVFLLLLPGAMEDTDAPRTAKPSPGTGTWTRWTRLTPWSWGCCPRPPAPRGGPPAEGLLRSLARWAGVRALGGTGGGHAELSRLIRARHAEVSRLRALHAGGSPWGGGRVSDRRLMETGGYRHLSRRGGSPLSVATTAAAATKAVDPEEPRSLGCADLATVSGLQYLGSGYTKAVYKAVLGPPTGSPSGWRGPVALKTVDLGGHDMATCVKEFGDPDGCYRLAAAKLLKEMTILGRLRHPNVVRLYGHCYRESNDVSDSLTAITELGSPLEMIQLLQTSWEERFRICLSLTRLLHYLAHSPLGPVALLDFRPRQFVLRDGELKASDLDDAGAGDPPCRWRGGAAGGAAGGPPPCFLHFPARNFTLPCCPRTRTCAGLNEKRNLYNAYRYFFTYLLPHSAPAGLRSQLNDIVNATGELRVGVDETLSRMESVLHQYQHGTYRSNHSQQLTTDYRELRGVAVSERHDYRCMPSYHPTACLLSVHDAGEAALVCSAHAPCRAFVLTGTLTWTGRQLVFFKTGAADFTSDPDKITYVRE
ncbi:unnamed protein product [Lampetra planeri]